MCGYREKMVAESFVVNGAHQTVVAAGFGSTGLEALPVLAQGNYSDGMEEIDCA